MVLGHRYPARGEASAHRGWRGSLGALPTYDRAAPMSRGSAPGIMQADRHGRKLTFRDTSIEELHTGGRTRVDLKQLTALVTVADVGSVTKAARLLHLVQPAITRQIRTLEDELGVALFDRTRQGMVPTPAGERLVDRARRVLQELERAQAEIRPTPGEVAGIVTVGVLASVIDPLVQPLVATVGARYPGVELRILTAFSGHLQQWLDAGDLDLSLLYNLADTPSLAVTPLLEEGLWAVAPPDAGLRPEDPMSWESLLEHRLVLPFPSNGLRV